MSIFSQIKISFLAREPRERWLLLILSGLVVLWALWQFLLTPILNSGQMARADLLKAQNDYRLMQQARPLLAQNIGGANQTSGGQTFTRQAFIDLARRQDISLTRVQPEADNSLSVWIDDVQTQRLYGFLQVLLTDYDVAMRRASIASSSDELVSAQFTLAPN